MKGISFLALLAVVAVAVAVAPTTHGLEAGALAEEGGVHVRRLSEEQPAELPEMITPEDAAAEIDENHAWWHHGGGGGGCSPGSRFWPRCKSFRHLEEEPLEDAENHAPWHGGGQGCFPGSRIWPRCRGWGGRGDCFPGSRFWPRCRSF